MLEFKKKKKEHYLRQNWVGSLETCQLMHDTFQWIRMGKGSPPVACFVTRD